MNRFYVHFIVLHILPAAEFVLILCFDHVIIIFIEEMFSQVLRHNTCLNSRQPVSKNTAMAATVE